MKNYEGFHMAGLNRTQLKFIAICAMVCDHTAWGFVEFWSPLGQILHVIGRLTIPIMCFFVAEGYRAMVVHYSCKPHSYPQHLREMAGVMELVHKNADDWNIDTSKVAVIGFSAGAHLAAQYSNRYDCKEIRQLFPESKQVQAAILSYPVITDDPQYINSGSFHNYLGYTPTNRNEKGCSNECMVSEKTPPTFIWMSKKHWSF